MYKYHVLIFFLILFVFGYFIYYIKKHKINEHYNNNKVEQVLKPINNKIKSILKSGNKKNKKHIKFNI